MAVLHVLREPGHRHEIVRKNIKKRPVSALSSLQAYADRHGAPSQSEVSKKRQKAARAIPNGVKKASQLAELARQSKALATKDQEHSQALAAEHSVVKLAYQNQQRLIMLRNDEIDELKQCLSTLKARVKDVVNLLTRE